MKAHIAPGHLALKEGQDWRIMGNVPSCTWFSFALLLFIDRFIVLSFGMGLDTKQGWLKHKGEETELKTKVHKIIVV